MKKIYIDGQAGTTGLRIRERLAERDDVTVLVLPEDKRKDPEARREMLNTADIVFLCLPDAASIEAVSMIENPAVRVLDTSTAHRTNPAWAYGFPELDASFREKIEASHRIAVPGCHASGFIALVRPLVQSGLLSPDARLSATSLTGYSGGGKSMIADYENPDRNPLLDAPRQYALGQAHKHLPEMKAYTGLDNPPVFLPIVGDFYSGMEVTVPLFGADVKGATPAEILALYHKTYDGSPLVRVADADGLASESGFLSAAAMTGKDSMEISVHGNGDRMILVARYDNLGKGASGAAVECLNILLGAEPTSNLVV
jgi:N-acetyl-gamma-glutamyl-phosphate reductase